MNLHIDELSEHAKIFKALGHPSRLIMVNALQSGEKCVCELQELIGDDISTISRHLGTLKEAGIISAQKRGTFMFYSLKLECLPTFLSCLSSAYTPKEIPLAKIQTNETKIQKI